MLLLICAVTLFPQDLVNSVCHIESGGAEIRSVLNGREVMADLNDEASSRDMDIYMFRRSTIHSTLT